MRIVRSSASPSICPPTASAITASAHMFLLHRRAPLLTSAWLRSLCTEDGYSFSSSLVVFADGAAQRGRLAKQCAALCCASPCAGWSAASTRPGHALCIVLGEVMVRGQCQQPPRAVLRRGMRRQHKPGRTPPSSCGTCAPPRSRRPTAPCAAAHRLAVQNHRQPGTGSAGSLRPSTSRGCRLSGGGRRRYPPAPPSTPHRAPCRCVDRLQPQQRQSGACLRRRQPRRLKPQLASLSPTRCACQRPAASQADGTPQPAQPCAPAACPPPVVNGNRPRTPQQIGGAVRRTHKAPATRRHRLAGAQAKQAKASGRTT